MSSRPSLLRRLTANPHRLDADALREQVAQLRCVPLESVQRGAFVTITGRLRRVVYNPRETVPTLDAELFDGTGSIELVWLGRRRIAGIEPGRRLVATGRVGVHDGDLAIYNPIYELRASV